MRLNLGTTRHNSPDSGSTLRLGLRVAIATLRSGRLGFELLMSEKVMLESIAGKRRYEAPTLAVIGTFEQVTQQTSVGAALDADLPANTPLPVVLNHLS